MTPYADFALTPLPFFHINPQGCTALAVMTIAGTIVPVDRFHPDRWSYTVADSGATVVHALGVIPAIFVKQPPAPDDRRHRVRFAFSPEVDPVFQDRFGLTPVDVRAMTETESAGVKEAAALRAIPTGLCIGQPRAGMDWRILDDAGQDVPLYQTGELLVRSAGPDPRRVTGAGKLG